MGWAEYTASSSQKWVLEDGNQAEIARGTYYIINANSGKYLQLNETTGGLVQNTLNSGNNMNIDIYENDNGTYKLHMPNLSYCLVVQNASTSNLAKTIWYPYNNTYNEQWMFVKA